MNDLPTSPHAAPPELTAPANDYLPEWTACRAAIERFDAILVDIRKFGFSFVAALVATDQIAKGQEWASHSPSAAFVIALLLLLVTIAIFALDAYYQCLLSGAVERSLDIESASGVSRRLTKFLCINSHATEASEITFYLYLILTGIAGFGSVAQLASEPLLVILQLVAIGVALWWMFWYRERVKLRCGLHEFKQGRDWGGEGKLCAISERASNAEWFAWAQNNKLCPPLKKPESTGGG